MRPDPLEEALGITQGPTLRRPVTRPLKDGHAITDDAWQALRNHYRTEADLADRLIHELERVAPIAHVAYRQNCVLVTDYEFGSASSEQRLWYVPNQYGGITITLPDDR